MHFNIHRTCRIFTLTIIFIINLNCYSFNSSQKNTVRALESFYLNFKKDRYKSASKHARKFLSHSTGNIKKLNPLVKIGLTASDKLAKSQQCSPNRYLSNVDFFYSKFISLYKKKCLSSAIKSISRSKKTYFNLSEKKVIKDNTQDFVKKISSKDFERRFIRLRDKDKTFLSKSIHQYITTNKVLPPKKALKYLIPSRSITTFIQSNKLFEKDERRSFSNVLNHMTKSFEHSYLNDETKDTDLKMDEITSFYEKNKSYLSNQKLWKKFISNGKSLLKSEDYGFALNFFETAKNYAKEEDLSESIFHIIFTKYLKNDMHEARQLIKKQNLVEQHKNFDSRLMYWVAYIVDINKEFKLAKRLYASTIKEHPLSFYAILSLKRLQKIAPDIRSDMIVRPRLNLEQKTKLSRKAKTNIGILSLFKAAQTKVLLDLQAINLRKMSQKSFFRKEFPHNVKAHYLITLFSKQSMHLHSFKEAYAHLNSKSISLSNEIIKALFPANFAKHIKSENKDIDYRIVQSLIRQESGFNQRARSPAGARGLMQIMPKTGKYMQKRLKTKDLYNPKVNILLGSKYLKYLLKKFDGNLMFALAAYNAGEGNVGKWLKSIPFTKDVVSDIELIPFKETRKYVKLIYRNLFFYRYQDGNSDVLKESPQKTFHIKTSSL